VSCILNVIEACRMEWLGHVLCMVGEGTVKKQTRKRGKKGKPRLRWMDDIKLDLMNVGVEMWRTRALERTE